MNKSIIEGPANPFKKGGPTHPLLPATKHDGELPPEEPGTVAGTLAAFQLILESVNLPGLKRPVDRQLQLNLP